MPQETGEEIVLVFDTKLRKPACVLLQALYGCGHNNEFLQRTFPEWLTEPTENMLRISATRSQWKQLAERNHAGKE